jgi:hypothetical protein
MWRGRQGSPRHHKARWVRRRIWRSVGTAEALISSPNEFTAINSKRGDARMTNVSPLGFDTYSRSPANSGELQMSVFLSP